MHLRTTPALAVAQVANAISSALRCSGPWRLLPKDLPPWRTAYRWFARLRDAGTWQDLNFTLLMADREREGRSASPSAAVMDRQSVRTTEAGGPRGFDAGKKVWGRKRHALVDTDGRPLLLQVGPASVQDRDGAVLLLKASRSLYPFIERTFADSGYAGKRVATATIIAVEIVRKQAGQVGFAVQPRRWVVERTFAWLGRNRRLARDFEATIASATAFLYATSTRLLTRRLEHATWVLRPILPSDQLCNHPIFIAAFRLPSSALMVVSDAPGGI